MLKPFPTLPPKIPNIMYKLIYIISLFKVLFIQFPIKIIHMYISYYLNTIIVEEKEEITKLEKEIKQDRYIIRDVATQTTPMIQDTKSEEILSDQVAILECLNILKRLEKK